VTINQRTIIWNDFRDSANAGHLLEKKKEDKVIMLGGRKIAVILPAYNAEKTLERTILDLDAQIVDHILLIDDYSSDGTVKLAKRMGIRCFAHDKNYGYGRNQKTCYHEALKLNPDVVIMLHPDYQYSPKLVPAMAAMIISGHYDLVLGSRILGGRARTSGMPCYKYFSNRILTFVQNLCLGSKLSEFHTGYRAFSRQVLDTLPFQNNSDDFLFDNEMLVQALYFGFEVGEISCPTRYFEEASSINFRRSTVYGLGVLWTSLRLLLQRSGLLKFQIFAKPKERVSRDYYYEAE
jgi:glycosyltransferase involved in cell wall biosynthesis